MLVETESDAKVKTVKAILRFSYDPPTGIRWVQEKGDTKSLTAPGPSRTWRRAHARDLRARGRPRAMLGLLLRGPAESKVRDFLLGNAAEGLKEKAEA